MICKIFTDSTEFLKQICRNSPENVGNMEQCCVVYSDATASTTVTVQSMM